MKILSFLLFIKLSNDHLFFTLLYPSLMNLTTYDQQMQKAIAYLEREFQGLQV
ncbi:MAG: hypothetical protein LBD75_01535 [Candidatus Peribacteria bacterium]|nr:hypothetical protein [Candidatus Peribacteria bacterium]